MRAEQRCSQRYPYKSEEISGYYAGPDCEAALQQNLLALSRFRAAERWGILQ